MSLPTVRDAVNQALSSNTVQTLWECGGDRWPELIEKAATELFLQKDTDTHVAEAIRLALIKVQTEGQIDPDQQP